MSSSLKLVTFGLLCVSCLPDPDPGSYYFSKTVWVTDTEVPTYETKKLEKGGKTVVEVKTGSNPIDSSNGAFLTQFFSLDGTSCTMRDLDNPQTNDLESGKVDQFTGSMLGPCENYHPEKISSVKITHTSGDGWRGEYIKISYEDKSFTCKLGEMLDNKASITFPCVESRGFVKVFSHDTSGGFFTNDQDALSKNSGDPNAKLYSILNKLEDYRDSDGSFHFKLCYPEVTGIGGSSCNEWFQSSNPTAIGLQYGKIKGFKAISLAFTGGSVGPWKGIGKSVSTSNFIDDAPQSGAWWTAIGARRGHPKGSSKIPGPAPNVVTKVELYVLPAPVEKCNEGFNPLNRECYRFEQVNNFKWEDAVRYCANLGAALASIHSQAENDYVTSLIPNERVLTWIGGYRTNNGWAWIDGSSWSGSAYTNWNTGEPSNNGNNEDKIYVYGTEFGIPKGKWNDASEETGINGLVCKHSLGNSDNGVLIARNNLLTTLPIMGHHFEISLQMWIESYNDGNSNGYSEFLRFSATGKDCCSPGDRIPAIFTNKNGFIHVASHVGTNGNYNKNFRLPVKTWINIVVKQYLENDKTMFEIIVDGKSEKIVNTKPISYENVKVWAASTGEIYPFANARIKNFLFKNLACDLGWTHLEHTGQCYKSVETALTRPKAVLACEAIHPRAHLVSIPDKKTNDFVISIVRTSSWIGLHKDSNEWRWADGTRASYTNWILDPPQPSGDGPFVEMLINWKDCGTDCGLWNDIPDNSLPSNYVCQYNPKPCSAGWQYMERTGQCYKSVETPLTRPQAILACEAANAKAHLAVIPDKITNDFVLSIVNYRSLIGLSKVSNEWRWADGTKATYTNWESNEPSGDGPSVEINRRVNGQWNDIPVDSTRYVTGYVCQYNPKPSACGLGWTYLEHTRKCYKHDPTKRSWTDAYWSCRSTSPSSTLSSVHDKTTNDFLMALSGRSSHTWLGGYQDDKENWHWADGSKWTGYNNWGPGQPDNYFGGQENHLGLNFGGPGQWNDFRIKDLLGSICQYDPGNLKPSVNIMLVGGESHMEGNVLLSGKPICDDDWDNNDAKVICRMLGFSSYGAIATHHSEFGLVSRDFIMDDVKCQGSETDIIDCNNRDTHNCGGHEGAGVRCWMSAECDSGWTYFKHSRKCYKSIKTNMDRADAIKACKESKPTANLVSIHDMTTNAFVQSMVSWRSWIGLQKINGHWVWPDGTKATVTNWLPRQPSGDGTFVEMFADKEGPGKWNDLSSSHKRGAVCQYDIFDVVSSDEDNFSAGDEEFFSPDLEEPQSTCSSNADCPSHLSCIRSVLSSDPGTCGDPWCWREEWECGSGARCIIVNHHPLCQDE